MRSAKTLIKRLFLSLGVIYTLSIFTYGFLAVAQVRKQKAIADLEMTLLATDLIVSNEIFSGNLLLAKEKISQLVSQRMQDSPCLRIVDSLKGKVLFESHDARFCNESSLVMRRTVYFDEGKKNAAFIITAGSNALPNPLLGFAGAQWIFAIAPLVLTLSFIRLIQKRLDMFVNIVQNAVAGDRPSSSSGNLISFRETEAIYELARSAKENLKFGAIARTTQALAHDVRKPFSMFKAIIQIVEATESDSEIREILHSTLPEVNQAMASVEGMIQDVMQIGSEAAPNQDEIHPESIIDTALNELCRVYPDCDISVDYDLRHSRPLMVDAFRIQRVFSNILGNAMQASGRKAEIWIKTSDKPGFVEFRLGNSGSLIPSENLPKLFDAFFTSGKKGGTGLGLAIAKKAVELHGGQIFCESSRSEKHPSGSVEFVFTLPSSENIYLPSNATLPTSSRQIHAKLEQLRNASRDRKDTNLHEVELERKIIQRIKNNPSPTKILIVEDEAVYRTDIVSMIARSDGLSSLIEVVVATNDTEAVKATIDHAPILVIQDIDLGSSSTNGIEIVKILRSQGFSGQICIHSNRFLVEDNTIAMKAGANMVIPKPMTRTHLLKLIHAAIPATEGQQRLIPHAPASTLPKARFAYVDDTLSFLVAMKRTFRDRAIVQDFDSTANFFDAVKADPTYLSQLDFIVTDYYFAADDMHNGLTFARALRELGFTRPILLASGAEFAEAELSSDIDGRIPKGLRDWSLLEPWLKK